MNNLEVFVNQAMLDFEEEKNKEQMINDLTIQSGAKK